MKQNRFIPGDLVYYYLPKSTAKVYAKVFVSSTDIVLSLESMSGKQYDYRGELYPIPLTPAILEKNGWKHQNDWYFFIKFDRGHIGVDFYHKTKDGKFLVDFDGKVITDVLYVSDLQHFLFGLGLNAEMEV